MGPAPFSSVSLFTSRGHDACLQATSVLPHVGRGLSTVTKWSERCTLLRSTGNSSGTQYPPQSTWSSAMPHRETSHKLSTVKPVVPQPPPKWPEGKMPPPRGGQPGQLQSERLEHRVRWSCGSTPPIRAARAYIILPLSLCGLEPI